MIKTILVDDEQGAIEYLASLIKEYCPQLTVVATATSVAEAVQKMNLHKPDILFLDVEMPNEIGFDLVEKVKDLDFKLVFTTAHREYALKAIKSSAYGYLLKPIDIDELQQLINEVVNNMPVDKKSRMTESKTAKQIKLQFPTAIGIIFITNDEIIRIEANLANSIVVLDTQKVNVLKNITEIEEVLNKQEFIRVHNSHIINKKYIQKYIKDDGGVFEMKDGSIIPISRSKKQKIMEMLMM